MRRRPKGRERAKKAKQPISSIDGGCCVVSLDCAGPGHHRSRDRPRAAATSRIVARAEVVKKDNSLTHDCDKCGYYHGYQVAAPVFSLSVHLPVSPIRCLPGACVPVPFAKPHHPFAAR